MIPVQDVVPSGRPPLATLALVAVNAMAFAAPVVAGQAPPAVSSLFGGSSLAYLVVGMWFLWLFGDNVEARVGRLSALSIYVAAGLLADLAPHLTPAVMELSGNDAVFVLPGADLDLTAKALAYGLRLNGGDRNRVQDVSHGATAA